MGAPANKRGGGRGRGGAGTRGRWSNDRGAFKGRDGNDFRRGGNAQSDDATRNLPSNAPSVPEGSMNGARFLELDFVTRLLKNEGPTTNLPHLDTTEKPFNNRCRLYVGNLSFGTTEKEVKELFEAYGKLSDMFVNTEKGFGFLSTETRALAEKARNELDGSMYKGRPLRVRFSFANSAIKVRNLNSFVTNELLEWGFQVFGQIERAVVICDERGKSTGEGIVEFSKRPSAVFALKKCTEGAYFLSRSSLPVIVEAYEPTDDSEGFPEEKLKLKNSRDFYKEREVGPWFAEPGSFEEQCADRWKQLFLLYKDKLDALKVEQKAEQDKLVAQMVYDRWTGETERLWQEQPAEPLDGGYKSRNNEACNAFVRHEGFYDQHRKFRESTDGTDGENGHVGGRGRGGQDDRQRWSQPQGRRRGMPGDHDDAPFIRRGRYNCY